MELTINKAKAKRRRDPHYKINIEFMEGDADGSQEDSIEFNDNPVEIDNMKRFILALACCNAAYPSGRGGYDEYNGLPEYDAFFVEEIDLEHYEDLLRKNNLPVDSSNEQSYEFVTNWLKENYNPGGIYMSHPSDSNYISTSFDGFTVKYIDENGDSKNVNITYSAEEQKRIAEAKKFFN